MTDEQEQYQPKNKVSECMATVTNITRQKMRPVGSYGGGYTFRFFPQRRNSI